MLRALVVENDADENRHHDGKMMLFYDSVKNQLILGWPGPIVVGCTEQRHVPHGGRYKIFFPPFSIILKLCIRGEDAFTPYTRSVTLILVSFLS